MNYIIHENSEDISLYFFNLVRPDVISQEDDITKSLYATFTHPVDGRFAFGFDVDEDVLVHHIWDGVDADELTQAIGLNNGQSNSFNNKIQSTIINQNGEEPPSGWDLGRFPSSAIMNQITTDIKSQNFMNNDGWFPTQED